MYKETKLHTPSTPQVQQPASATDPRYSTSGILNAQIKEKNRQGLLSTYSGRTGRDVDINKFADQKISARNPSAVSALEHLSRMYSGVARSASALGVNNENTSDFGTAATNINKYNESVSAVNNYLSSYGLSKKSGVVKAQGAHNYDKRRGHSDNFGASNKDEIASSVNNLANSTANTFNELEKTVKKQKQPAKQ